MAKYITFKASTNVMQLFDCPNGYVPQGTVKCGTLVAGGTVQAGNTFDVADFKQMKDSNGNLRSAAHILKYVNFGNGEAYIWADDLKLATAANEGAIKAKGYAQAYFTPKNIIIGVVAIGTIFGILKLTKAI